MHGITCRLLFSCEAERAIGIRNHSVQGNNKACRDWKVVNSTASMITTTARFLGALNDTLSLTCSLVTRSVSNKVSKARSRDKDLQARDETTDRVLVSPTSTVSLATLPSYNRERSQINCISVLAMVEG